MSKVALALLALLALIAAPAAQAQVKATLETAPLFDDEAGGDADADDPAIWVHPTDRRGTLVVGTKKNAGLDVYDLQGRTLQSIPSDPGRFNNVDVVTGVRLDGKTRDLVVTSDRGLDQLRVFAIDPAKARKGQPPLTDITTPNAPLVFSATPEEVEVQATAYGLAAYNDRGDGFVAVSRRSRTAVALYKLIAAPNDTVSYVRVDDFTLPDTFRLPNGTRWTPCEDPGDGPQVEGMTFDPQRGLLFAAQEDIGLWVVKVGRHGFTGQPTLLQKVKEFGVPGTFDPETEECVLGADPGFGGRHVAADIEGLTIWRIPFVRDILLVSSQGDSRFVAYGDGGLGGFIGEFTITDGTVDGVEHSDGAQVLAEPLPGFPLGLLVTHDGENRPDPEERASTNFKYTRLERVGVALLLQPF
ncbi:phytase [Solirubrobacter sp. CPCC 204708]|uniref:Phytase n=1 Tax=Solirubrobacter deserti TaxID=2282478 RepID=A0ABT4RRI4_9ACTN|nr:phytase [Solirubrobacter deserti]MBE2314796.1 phytase [Solirubrobacter deserti]MDA0141206.1 phytase [Solirubrobacter deserti]